MMRHGETLVLAPGMSKFLDVEQNNVGALMFEHNLFVAMMFGSHSGSSCDVQKPPHDNKMLKTVQARN